MALVGSRSSNILMCPLIRIRLCREIESMGKAVTRIRKVTPLAYALLSFPAVTFGLGVWQLRRRRWKIDLVEEIKENAFKPPVLLPEDLREVQHMNYHPVKLVGEFLHDQEIILSLKQYIDDYSSAAPSGFGGGVVHASGANVITPFQLEGRNVTVLVNRGWVAKSRTSPDQRQEGQVSGRQEIIGLIRADYKKPYFVGNNEPEKDIWWYVDVDAMAMSRNAAPVYVVADRDSTVQGGPVGGQMILRFHNPHTGYMLTWFGLSLTTIWMWLVRHLRQALR